MLFLFSYFQGLLLGLSLIIAIGAQNLFVFNQGLIGKHVLFVCLFCSISDALLILIGYFKIILQSLIVRGFLLILLNATTLLNIPINSLILVLLSFAI